MHLDAAEMDSDKVSDTGSFSVMWRKTVDRRTRYAKLAQSCLDAFLADIGDATLLTPSERIDIETAALDMARAQEMQARFARGEAAPVDVAAASHLARKGRSAVARIVRRLGAKRRGMR